MNTKKYKITLSEQEISRINTIISNLEEDPRIILRARILLLSDSTNSPELTIQQIANEVKSTRQTVTKIRNIYHEQGFDVAINVLNKSTYDNCLVNDKDFLKKITDLINSAPPDGCSKWSLRKISAECIKRGYVDYISQTTIADILKKNNIQL